MQSGRMTRLGDFAEFFQGEVNETNERAKGTISYNAPDGQLVIRGAAVCLYVVRAASQGKDFYVLKNKFLDGKGEGGKAFHHQQSRIAVQESSPQNNFRRIIASFVPAGEFCNHTINYCPLHKSRISAGMLLAVLNTKLADWYFRLGSTNAHVSHYQIGNLPYPKFTDSSECSQMLRSSVLRKLRAGQTDEAFGELTIVMEKPPFDCVLQDAIKEAVDQIKDKETRRGSISRSDRSALSPEAQPYQDFIDRIFFAMAGLSPEESAGLEERLATML
jgi:hypothetical protein